MSKNKVIFFSALGIFICFAGYALWRELDRNQKQIRSGISGVVHLASGIGAGVVRTDNAHVILIDPQSRQPVALNTLNPLVPPLTFYVGQEHVLGNYQLQGDYHLLIVSDKNGRLENPVLGEVIGEITPPLPLATEGFQYYLNKPFREWPLRPQSDFRKEDPALMIQGKLKVKAELTAQVEETDRLVILLFDPEQARPVAIKIIPHFYDGQSFSIGQIHAMPGQNLRGSYSLRILTDKNNQPFHPAPGEIVGRSTDLIPLGTMGLEFVLDQNYMK